VADSSNVILTAGDVAGDAEGNPGAALTAALLHRLLDDNPDATVLALGDHAYSSGTAEEYETHYRPTWGDERILSRTWPCPGNHDYRTEGASPYFEFFGARAHGGETPPQPRGYYSVDVAGWHIVSLNTEIENDEGSEQVRWLREDLDSRVNKPILSFFHRARFGSGGHLNSDEPEVFWKVLFEHRAEIVLSGHSHHYERFAQQSPDREPDPQGIREFIVGTGGRGLFDPVLEAFWRQRNSEVRNYKTFGILKLVLHPDGYEWAFVPVEGSALVDESAEKNALNPH
jgi:acid phosphatase type 7